jgi:hypothetical protein
MSTPQRQNDRYENYIPVAARVVKFYEDHPAGRILTAIVEHDHTSGFILMRAEVYRNSDDQLPSATGHAFEIQGEGFVNKTSHIENCETGAVGRALANLGYEVKESPRPQEAQKPRPQPAPAAVSRLPEREEKGEVFDREKATQQIKDLWLILKDKRHPVTKDGATCHNYVNDRFKVSGGLNELTPQNFADLKLDLNSMLDSMAVE